MWEAGGGVGRCGRVCSPHPQSPRHLGGRAGSVLAIGVLEGDDFFWDSGLSFWTASKAKN